MQTRRPPRSPSYMLASFALTKCGNGDEIAFVLEAARDIESIDLNETALLVQESALRRRLVAPPVEASLDWPPEEE